MENEKCEFSNGRECAYEIIDAAITHTIKHANDMLDRDDLTDAQSASWNKCIADVQAAAAFISKIEAQDPGEFNVSHLGRNDIHFSVITMVMKRYHDKARHDADNADSIMRSLGEYQLINFVERTMMESMPTPKAKA